MERGAAGEWERGRCWPENVGGTGLQAEAVADVRRQTLDLKVVGGHGWWRLERLLHLTLRSCWCLAGDLDGG